MLKYEFEILKDGGVWKSASLDHFSDMTEVWSTVAEFVRDESGSGGLLRVKNDAGAFVILMAVNVARQSLKKFGRDGIEIAASVAAVGYRA